MPIPRTSFVRRLAIGLLLVTIVIGVTWRSSLAADISDVCSEHDPPKVFEAVKNTPSAARLVSRSAILAGDGQNTLIFDSPYSAPAEGEKYRVLIQGKPLESKKRLHLIDTVLVQPLDTDTSLAKTLSVDPHATMISFTLPQEPTGYWALNWRPYRIFLMHCVKDGPKVASIEMLVSPRNTSIFAVFAATVIMYLAVVAAARTVFRKPVRFWRCLDPVVLTAGPNGKGNLSKLQLLFFSLIVFAMLAYIYARTGVLSDLSPTILILLGISAVGAATSKATDVNANRLAFGNWIWMIRKHWLPPGGLAAVNSALLRDLVTSDGEFDVYHFQMLIFSLVVGVSLLAIGLNGLASFDVPANFLGVLGLSQVVYVGGKLVAPPSCTELDKAISDLRDLETKFKAQATTANKGPPQSLAAAMLLAPTEYGAFKNAVGPAKDMADEVLKFDPRPGDPAPTLEPDYV